MAAEDGPGHLRLAARICTKKKKFREMSTNQRGAFKFINRFRTIQNT
jgi:hypothetical protein